MFILDMHWLYFKITATTRSIFVADSYSTFYEIYYVNEYGNDFL